jgi:hypothetical protein
MGVTWSLSLASYINVLRNSSECFSGNCNTNSAVEVAHKRSCCLCQMPLSHWSMDDINLLLCWSHHNYKSFNYGNVRDGNKNVFVSLFPIDSQQVFHCESCQTALKVAIVWQQNSEHWQMTECQSFKCRSDWDRLRNEWRVLKYSFMIWQWQLLICHGFQDLLHYPCRGIFI